ncbi:helix-turn-helix domain-containing protein [Streptomyces sp. NPDC055815]
MPSKSVVAAFTHAAGGDLAEAVRLLEAADKAEAERLEAAVPVRKLYVPGPVSTLRGLGRAMRRVKDDAGLSARALERMTGGTVPRSTLALVLRGKRLPSARLLDAFLGACDARPDVVRHLNTVRDRLDPRPAPPRPADHDLQPAVYPCADADPRREALLDRAERGHAFRARRGLPEARELDEHDEHLHEELRQEQRRKKVDRKAE